MERAKKIERARSVTKMRTCEICKDKLEKADIGTRCFACDTMQGINEDLSSMYSDDLEPLES